MTQNKQRPDRAYLLRCWQEGEAASVEGFSWRFWVEEISHERRQKGFGSLETLFAFFQAELAGDEEASPDNENTPS
jgi:hypothetical protein